MAITLEQEGAPAVVPFLKWAGGKRWLTSKHSDVFPNKYNRFIEPFLGSGAVFFHLNPDKGLLSDKNPDLINTYKAIKTDWKKVQSALQEHNNFHDHDYYYEERKRQRRADHTKAAQFIYLNRTCWNGLYRVNLKGQFNVPIGTKDAVCLPTDDFEKISKTLQKVTLQVSDFEAVIDSAQEGDFVFADPPYTVAHNMNAFVKYNEKIFSWSDQIRLYDSIQKAVKRGVMVTMTNADHDSVESLYGGLGSIKKISRHSVISGKNSGRRFTSELLIRFGWE